MTAPVTADRDVAFERAEHALDILKAWARERVRDKRPFAIVMSDCVAYRFVWFERGWLLRRMLRQPIVGCCDTRAQVDEGEVLGAITACSGVVLMQDKGLPV